MQRTKWNTSVRSGWAFISLLWLVRRNKVHPHASVGQANLKLCWDYFRLKQCSSMLSFGLVSGGPAVKSGGPLGRPAGMWTICKRHPKNVARPCWTDQPKDTVRAEQDKKEKRKMEQGRICCRRKRSVIKWNLQLIGDERWRMRLRNASGKMGRELFIRQRVTSNGLPLACIRRQTYCTILDNKSACHGVKRRRKPAGKK